MYLRKVQLNPVNGAPGRFEFAAEGIGVRSRRRTPIGVLLCALAFVTLSACFSGNRRAAADAVLVSERPDLAEFTPIKDDALAARYAPVLVPSPDYGDPVALYYRASKDTKGNTHLTYHFLWEFERNDTGGCLPFLSRNIYTGGLGLQRTMFGPGDIELVSLQIDPAGRVFALFYETAENYDPSSFGVKHKRVSRLVTSGEIKGPYLFEVISWNHLFEAREMESLSDAERANLVQLTPEYFSEKLWRQYEMYKAEESFFSRSRAHEPFEREAFE
ncbi:MAG: hypothetical protein NXI24_01160 [bacterium]|nr:hypothetical protein [bacterium]